MSEYSSQRASVNREASRDTEQLLGLVAQLQAELDELRRELAESNRLAQLGMLTAGLAHEMNNFLTPIRSYAQLALARLDEKQATLKALHAAVQGTQKAGRLAERVMSLAANNSVFETRVCDVKAVVGSALVCMTPMNEEQGIEVWTEVEPTEVAIDALALEQVLINLIANACQAMSGSQGDRQIHMASQRVGNRLILDVRDTGPGVDVELRDKVFEPFVTSTPSMRGGTQCLSPTAPGAGGGSGLGLSICRQLVEAVDGTITLEKTDERGTIFRINLPIATES